MPQSLFERLGSGPSQRLSPVPDERILVAAALGFLEKELFETLQARLMRLEEVVSGLESLRDQGPSEEGIVAYRWATERGLHLGAEIMLDIGSHILSGKLGVAPESYDDIIVQLGRHQVLSAEILDKLRGLAGFRNLLVHDYMRLDPRRVREILDQAPEIYSGFGAAIRDWMSRHFEQ